MITVKIIADSISKGGNRITTFELEYPRFIHSEFMTHRQFSRNAASSRAIPIQKMIDHINESPAEPIHWGENMAGMQAKNELQEPNRSLVKGLWTEAKTIICDIAYKMLFLGIHKQIANRILEPFQIIKVVMTTTEIQNFFYLRSHQDAQPEIKMLSDLMQAEYNKSTPKQLLPGEWHVPYYEDGVWNSTREHSLSDALAISSSCCAQVSYRKLDNTLKKARDIFKRLFETEPMHASPFEHQASPMIEESASSFMNPESWEEGVTHMDRQGMFWSGNFKGWVQHRQIIQDKESK